MKRTMLMAVMAMMTVMAGVSQQCPVSVSWQMGKNMQRTYTSTFTITNVSNALLEGGWALYYNKFSNNIKMAEDEVMDLTPVRNNNYIQLKPNARYKALKPGESVTVTVVTDGSLRNVSDRPTGMHFVAEGSQKAVPVDLQIAPLLGPEQFSVSQWVNYPDGEYMFAENAISNPAGGVAKGNPYDILPTPKSIVLDEKGRKMSVPAEVSIIKNALYLQEVRDYLALKLADLGINVVDGAKFRINLSIAPNIDANRECYVLTTARGGITIDGQSAEAVFNGVKTLLAVLWRSGCYRLPCAQVKDYPDLHYRGIMIDVARNFTTYEDMLNLIDRLAEYKINVLQLHFCDDEAWRLEIPGLPELTQVGARKGFSLNDYESGFLMQTYAGSGDPNDGKAPANGYYTRWQFVEMLRYAHRRGVKIIPEIETPGHARAAIVAMRHRYDKYINTDADKANYYRNYDLDDAGRFESAQGFGDNVLNVAEKGTYNFLQKVITEIMNMYGDAGLRFDVLHLGGDEVPKGCWDHSPKVKNLMKAKNFTCERDVAEYFFMGIADWLKDRGVRVEGWQEVSTNHSDSYSMHVSGMLAGVNVWSTIGKRDTIAYTLANRGVPVIISNVNNLYLDMVYRPHENENGLTWGGSVDEINSWETLPFNIYRSAQTNIDGSRKDLATADFGKPALRYPENIIGMQAQLWTETVHNYTMMQQYIFPKVFGLVERAWNVRPDWGEGSLDRTKYEVARAAYNLKIGRRELPYLAKRGTRFHMAQAGAEVRNGKLVVNTPYEGVEVRYTLDGSEPTRQSQLFTAPVDVPQGTSIIKVKAFYEGEESVATRLVVE
ncbi:MAG: family 20 glycosylhydrolase [Muribaculaceae bacterium]